VYYSMKEYRYLTLMSENFSHLAADYLDGKKDQKSNTTPITETTKTSSLLQEGALNSQVPLRKAYREALAKAKQDLKEQKNDLLTTVLDLHKEKIQEQINLLGKDFDFVSILVPGKDAKAHEKTKAIQNILLLCGYGLDGFGNDGYYGTKERGETAKAVKELQTALGMTGNNADGLFGKKTLTALKTMGKFEDTTKVEIQKETLPTIVKKQPQQTDTEKVETKKETTTNVEESKEILKPTETKLGEDGKVHFKVNGKEITSEKTYTRCQKFWNNERLFVTTNVGAGFIDTEGREIIPAKYQVVWGFANKKAQVEKNGKRGYIDTTGGEVIPLAYKSLELPNLYGVYPEIEDTEKNYAIIQDTQTQPALFSIRDKSTFAPLTKQKYTEIKANPDGTYTGTLGLKNATDKYFTIELSTDDKGNPTATEKASWYNSLSFYK